MTSPDPTASHAHHPLPHQASSDASSISIDTGEPSQIASTVDDLARPRETAHDRTQPLETSRDLERPHGVSGDLAKPHATSQDLSRSHGVSDGGGIDLGSQVVIPDGNAITIEAALELAKTERYPISKSTLQRRAQKWKAQGTTASVKSVLITIDGKGSSYRLDRDDFAAWIFDQKNNMPEADLEPSHFTSPSTDIPHPVAPETPGGGDRYTQQVERENVLLREQLTIKDRQIEKLTLSQDRIMENMAMQNTLIQGFQRMLGLGPAKGPR